MKERRLPCRAAALLAVLLLPACQQQGGGAGLRTYPDAVVNINQVDPAYRPFFTSQHGANYTLSDQRKAYLAAARTARTPVPKYAPSSTASSSRSKASSRKKASSGRKASSRQTAKKGKSRTSRQKKKR